MIRSVNNCGGGEKGRGEEVVMGQGGGVEGEAGINLIVDVCVASTVKMSFPPKLTIHAYESGRAVWWQHMV